MQVCICVGETILSQCPETSLSEYIPLYLQQTTAKDNHVCSGNVLTLTGRIYFINAAKVDAPVFLHCTGTVTNPSDYSSTVSENDNRY